MRKPGILGDVVAKEGTGGAIGLLQSRAANSVPNANRSAGIFATPGYNPSVPMPRPNVPEPRTGLLGRIGQGANSILGNIGDAYNKFTTGPYASQRLSGISEAMGARTDRPMRYSERLSTGLNLGREREQAQRKFDLEQIRKDQELKMEEAAARNVKKGSYPSTYVTPDRKLIETYFNPVLGERLVQGTDDPIPAGSMRLSESDVPQYQDMIKLEDELNSENATMTAVDRYIQDIKTARTGYKRIVDDVKAKVYTFMDKEGLTEEELATPRGRARLQGLIGQFRVDVVGPGVMTEQDALRILIALGGDMSAFTPDVITLELLTDLRDKAANRYESKATRFNSLLDNSPSTSVVRGVFGRIELDETSSETPSKSSDKTTKGKERDSRGRPKDSPDPSSGEAIVITDAMLSKGSK